MALAGWYLAGLTAVEDIVNRDFIMSRVFLGCCHSDYKHCLIKDMEIAGKIQDKGPGRRRHLGRQLQGESRCLKLFVETCVRSGLHRCVRDDISCTRPGS